uniref:Type IV pilin biogenesis protein n=1 Tax=Mesocestoides corti TaxID=53468 RepID=A0A5K3ETM2_MESCO
MLTYIELHKQRLEGTALWIAGSVCWFLIGPQRLKASNLNVPFLNALFPLVE